MIDLLARTHLDGRQVLQITKIRMAPPLLLLSSSSSSFLGFWLTPPPPPPLWQTGRQGHGRRTGERGKVFPHGDPRREMERFDSVVHRARCSEETTAVEILSR